MLPRASRDGDWYKRWRQGRGRETYEAQVDRQFIRSLQRRYGDDVLDRDPELVAWLSLVRRFKRQRGQGGSMKKQDEAVPGFLRSSTLEKALEIIGDSRAQAADIAEIKRLLERISSRLDVIEETLVPERVAAPVLPLVNPQAAPAAQTEQKWLTAGDVASRTQCGKRAVLRAAAAEKLRAVRINQRGDLRFLQEWVDQWIQGS